MRSRICWACCKIGLSPGGKQTPSPILVILPDALRYWVACAIAERRV